MIRDIALREGVDIRYNSEVDSFDKDTVTVKLKNGQTLSADFVVCADGPDSIERHHITEEEAPPFTTYVVLSLSIPAESLRADPELKHWGESDDWSIWVGSGYMVRANLVVRLSFDSHTHKLIYLGTEARVQFNIDTAQWCNSGEGRGDWRALGLVKVLYFKRLRFGEVYF
jgi:2-polyprenyl-6-methoxyphenol hydroxylase-like FAD-dependent oxidoreductase